MTFKMPEKILIYPQLKYPSGEPTGAYTALEFSEERGGTKYVRAGVSQDVPLVEGQYRWVKVHKKKPWKVGEVYRDICNGKLCIVLSLEGRFWPDEVYKIGPVIEPPQD